MSYEGRQVPQFYLTPHSQCPYLEERQERKVFTHLLGDQAAYLNDILTQGGFRRSQNIAYRPACDTCTACISVRVKVDAFTPTRSMKRTITSNRDIKAEFCDAEATQEQYSLFRDYVETRHSEGGMSDMSVFDFSSMIEESFVDTFVVEYRERVKIPLSPPDPQKGQLLGVALSDKLQDGLSMVYSFFDPEHEKRGLGTLMILDHIERARKQGLPYLYLGYWVDGSRKMEYKRRFTPQEHLTRDGWVVRD